ncbi:ABC transporter permease [Saccharicrinis sp. FJH2]|uniref:ABC transporter permease n=1 Tax=Saccharicrinis sp. FJH65 TaxID=3344659 RepID=UPI0035F3C16D
MFKNEFIITIRSLWKYKRYSLINILGLAIGLACFLIISMWVQDELSFDTFHKNADQIYIVFRKDNKGLSGATSQRLATGTKSEFPEVINATSYSPLPESLKPLLKYQNNGYSEHIALTDPEFFKIFSFPFIEGDPEHVFDDPNSIILTQRMCQKYFGDQDPLGKSIELTFLGQKSLMRVSGILKNIPANTSFKREFFIPIDFIKTYGVNWDNWKNQSPETYIQVQGKIDETELASKITAYKQANYKEEGVSYSLLPLKKIHLRTSHVSFFNSTGDIKYVYIFSIIAAIILLMACMNYINLSNALSLKRAKEIGIKKVAGAGRKRLVIKYFGETLILTFVALGIALILVKLMLPTLNSVAAKSLIISVTNSGFLLTIVSAVLITGIISGLYPAVFMSSFQPVKILKGKFDGGTKSLSLRKALIIFQFTLSIIIIISTITVLSQLKFIQNAKLGFDKENIACIKIKGDIQKNYEAFKNTLLQNTEIQSICRSEPLNAAALGKTEGIDWPGKEGKFSVWVLNVDNDFQSTYKIDMAAGRFFSDQHPSDQTAAYVLNETAVHQMGLENPLGTEITFWGRKGKIIGIAHDFNFNSLHHAIEPTVMRIPSGKEAGIYFRSVSIRLKPNSLPQSMTFVKETWRRFYPNEPMEYYFFDQDLNSSYISEFRMGSLFKYFSFLAIFIACLGLYGLTAFSIEQHFKEIGVHKVLGATMSNIVLVFSRNYLKWILVANIIAWPLAYYAMKQWLQNFAYRISPGIWPFIFSGAIVFTVALITIGWLAMRAATKNPVEALRYE